MAEMTTDRWIAFCALLASISAVMVSISSDSMNRKHMRLSVKPIPAVLYVQTSDDLTVSLKNVGTGPLVLKKLEYVSKNGRKSATIIDRDEFSPSFVGEIVLFELDDVSAISSASHRNLIRFDAVPADIPSQLRNQAIRTVLDKVTVRVEYTDIYETKFPVFEYRLNSKNILPE
jgi:hypothetical protein